MDMNEVIREALVEVKKVCYICQNAGNLYGNEIYCYKGQHRVYADSACEHWILKNWLERERKA